MKKIIVIIFIFILLAIGFLLSFNYISRDGEFTKLSHSTAEKGYFNDGRVMYLGYDFKWEGIGNPFLEKVEIIKKDGTIVAKDDDEICIEPYLSSTQRIGVLDEETVMKKGLNDDFINVKNFQVDEYFYLVLRVEIVGNDVNNVVNDTASLKITYTKYGITQFQNIPFDDGIITDE